jgi:F-type H+-transporting ATPase subunit delta
MAEAATIARPYAEAVFGLADKAGALAKWSEALAGMAQAVAHPEVQACISDPKLGADRLYALVVSFSRVELPADIQNFVRVLIANGRLALLPEIHAQFVALKNEREGVVEAEIRSAFPLEAAQLKDLVAGLERRFKRRIQPQVVVDRDLIGGARITVGDEVIDGSVRGRLEEMAAALKT